MTRVFSHIPSTSLTNILLWLAAVHQLRYFKSAFSILITLGRQDLPCTCLADHVLGSIALTDVRTQVVELSVEAVDAT